MKKGTAIKQSEYADEYLAPSDLEDLLCLLPCKCEETDEKSHVDGKLMIYLDNDDDTVHPDFLIIEWEV